MFQLPRDCRVFSALKPAAQWGWNEILANKMVYLLETLVWQKTKDAQKKMPQHKPEPFVPEFMKSMESQREIAGQSEAHTTDDIREILARKRTK